MSKPIARAKLDVGMTVLLGVPGISMPSDWWIGTVLWFDKNHALVEQSHIGGGGQPYPNLLPRDHVRAIGSVHDLGEIQRRCREEFEPLTDAVREAEEELQAARDAVYVRLDEIAEAEPMRDAGAGI
jgi:hypothetical protein